MSTKQPNRRQFLKAATAAGIAAGAASLPSRVRANEPTGRKGKKFVVAMMGIGIRGKDLFRLIGKRDDVEVAYLAEPDQNRWKDATDIIQKESIPQNPKFVKDFRTILDDKRIDAIFNATPDHWHALGTISACQAGKDVYSEKPASHTPWEGRQMVKAARKYNRIVQHGTHTRSGDYAHAAVEYIKSGKLGDVHLARIVNMKEWKPIGHKEDAPTPEGFDYNLWTGPAPLKPYNPNRAHYRWHWWWDFSGGDIINDGIHQVDLARWLIGKDFPKSVSAGGSRHYDHDGQTPDTQVVTWEFDNNLTLVFEMALWTPYMKKLSWDKRQPYTFPNWPFDGMRIEIYGTKGLMYFARHGGGWQVFDESSETKPVAQQGDVKLDAKHLDNFFDCMESRKTPNADIEEGHRSTLLSQMGNISYRCGGRKLLFDPTTESFPNEPDANALLKRTYREGFVVPDEV